MGLQVDTTASILYNDDSALAVFTARQLC